MSTYSEKLKDPRWQKKRLEILERANWTCEICGRTKETLHVHHKSYSKSEPWDISNSKLICICETCHWMIHKDNLKIEEVKFFYSKKYHKFLTNMYKELVTAGFENRNKIMVIAIKTLIKFKIK